MTMNSNFENDQTPPDNVGDSNLSESLADMDLDPGSSSEDKRSRDDSEVAEEETDQSSPPTKRQRREEDDEDDDEEEEVGEDASEQQDVIEEDLDGSQQRPILIDDVDQSEDASQQHEMAQDDVEIGSSLENNVNSSHGDEERDNQEPLPLRPVNTNTNSPNPVADPAASPVINPAAPAVSPVAYSDDVSMAEGSMISIDMPPPDPNLPPVEAHLSIAFAASLQELSDAQDYHEEAVMLEVAARRRRRRTERNWRRYYRLLCALRAMRSSSTTPRPAWRTGIRNQPDPGQFVTGMEYIRHVLSELYELSDDEE
ncbi:hypothetical protein CEP52_000573 [Fusarium oligoseptatum]|uniref:Uncharacterized protein n=1 Tax=Fusarium oligoseptatum TaxID=2604345 RepID=A0A428UNP0_9HYPO|nr:hypothetical protein CEP52_000573 [Fusarium oligoseptatum]